MSEEKPKFRGERLSIYAGEPLALVLGGHDENRSGRVNQVCARYLAIVADSQPRWSQAQWSAVCDALNGCWLGDDLSLRYLWAEVADTQGLGDKWGIDQDALVRELREMPMAGKVAVVELVERFWAHCDRDTSAALAAAGVVTA